MSKEKKIKVKDLRKWTIHLCVSLGILLTVLFLLTSVIDMSEHQDILMYSILLGFGGTVAYWIYTYRIFNKYVSIKEFREINKNIDDIILKKQLLNQGFDEDEITKILKDRPVSSYIARQQQTSANTKEVDVSSSLENLKEGFVISNKLLTKAGLGIVIDSKSEEIAIIQQNKEIQYVQFNQIHSYDVSLAEAGSGNGAMALASITGNDSLYRLGMANTVAGNKNIYSYVIKLVLNDVDTADIDVDILHKKMLNSSVEFMEIDKVGKSITTFLDKIITKKSENTSKSNLNEIKELKELLDMGAITQEEFNEKKKELLK